ncbi:hypothetical protein LCGC14_0712210 [marine sediment metagenome]|uniref:Uncharacterized protein n=1 Tax=marine sediment metagenome TaxID=412755 RepID=A0A0F9QEQ2_9ZZZZ
MTDIIDIITDNWDTDIIALPSIINGLILNRRFYGRVISTELIDILDETEGVTGRRFFDSESHDGYDTFIEAGSESDAKLIIKALKKICSTYTPVAGEENILQWVGGSWGNFNDVRIKFKFILIIRKSGIASY